MVYSHFCRTTGDVIFYCIQDFYLLTGGVFGLYSWFLVHSFVFGIVIHHVVGFIICWVVVDCRCRGVVVVIFGIILGYVSAVFIVCDVSTGTVFIGYVIMVIIHSFCDVVCCGIIVISIYG